MIAPVAFMAAIRDEAKAAGAGTLPEELRYRSRGGRKTP
jgi:hypothetical protein